MHAIPADELAETRAALAPTLEAVAAILPWLAKPRELRFDPALNQRWITASQQLTQAWSDRFNQGAEAIRPAIFVLYSVALESADADCLRLGEALASAVDQLETGQPGPRLIAALASCVESLNNSEGLEHPLFPERASHFAQRLEGQAMPGAATETRSSVLDRLFVSEAAESLERMHDALALLPPDASTLQQVATELAQAAENIELFGVRHLARQLAESISVESPDLENELARARIKADLQQLAETIAAVNV
ncbi:MAG: hypothetical protein CVU16_14090 [Betaproteobacteria bacterium HGW-Betaproteobacteria-10]|nr:MAG: hypothetical protein CVU16_14090 [Betaproteobacteria bacterium HGW-Betaproteobacteria-10]